MLRYLTRPGVMCRCLLLPFMLITALTHAQRSDYRQIEWVDLLPDADLDALWQAPDWLQGIGEGSDLDDLAAASSSSLIASESEQRYFDALQSVSVRPEFDGEKVRIPGFIVPLEYDEELRITDFFLVPYFGACIHYPPPPPNQIIHVSHEGGLASINIWDPFWVEGRIKLDLVSNELGDAAYSIVESSVFPYTGP